MTHDLKSWPAHFDLLLRGRRFEVRQNDRNFALRDYVHISEFLPARGELTGRTLDFVIDDLAPFGLPGTEHTAAWLILHYVAITTTPAPPAPPPPPRPAEEPTLVLWANVVEANRVLQTVRDERGEQHQLFGRSRAVAATNGDPGRLSFYADGSKRFVRSVCSCAQGVGNSFPEEHDLCTGCGMPVKFQNPFGRAARGL